MTILLFELKYSDTINYETILFSFCAELKSKKRLYSQVRTVKSSLEHNLGNNVFRAFRESNSGHFGGMRALFLLATVTIKTTNRCNQCRKG